jgi:hypothetical protein
VVGYVAVGVVGLTVVLGVVGALLGLGGAGAPPATTASSAPTETSTATSSLTPTATPTPTTEEATTPTATATPTPTPTPTATATERPDVAVVIEYAGDWQGSLALVAPGESESRSIGGEGRRRITVADDWTTVSVNAQKQDDSDATIRVAIVRGDTVLAETATDSAYGVAQVSEQVR